MPASSCHPGGAVMGHGDGSVKFYNDNIDAGNPTLKSTGSVSCSGPSKRGVLGACGSINSGVFNSLN